ncbi:unnamed protein product [Lampetra fluviatilis]
MAASTADAAGEQGAARRRAAHGMLQRYYGLGGPEAPGVAGTQTPESRGPCDIDGADFDPEIYLGQLRKDCSLPDLMSREADMVRQIRALDSDMQTLVYENYNKFISATDTIRKMKNDFKKMEDEMECLTSNMAAITEFSGKISGTLQDRRQHITKLSGVHVLLRKLQFLFELPARLHKCIELAAWGQAVRYYSKARAVLHQYQHMPSFRGIQDDCSSIMTALAHTLHERFRDREASAKELAECVDLLLQLGEPPAHLWDEFLSHARARLCCDLETLQSVPGDAGRMQLDAGNFGGSLEESGNVQSPPTDILEFIDRGCNGFISNMCLSIASFQQLFISQCSDGDSAQALEKLQAFVNELMERYFELVEARVKEEKSLGDNSLLVRALDRFHRRLQALSRLLPGLGVVAVGMGIVERSARARLQQYARALEEFLADCLTDARQALAAPRLVGKDSPSLPELLAQLSCATLNKIKAVLAEVQLFCAKDITFSVKPYFKGEFCSQGVREGLVVGFIQHVCALGKHYSEGSPGGPGERGATPPALLLLLSRLCLDYETSTISYILTLTDEQFLVQDESPMTSVSALCVRAREAATRLLTHYVRVQGLTLSQMLRKSVETRDWVHSIEPRNVRAVMKRVVEDITAIDVQVGLLFEEGVRKAHSSDSSKRAFSAHSSSRQLQQPPPRYAPSYTPSAPMDTSLLSNIQKLFSERVDIFSPVEFSKVSVLTGIIKISLKTFLECVRLRTFGRFGLQQIQVDCHYLQLYLWRFVSEEALVHALLDEVLASTLQRCIQPIPMETSVIEVICERG